MEVDFAKIEKKWRDRWSKEKVFEVSEKSKKKKHYVLEMFPYPSGSGLHLGHAWNYTLGDIIARFKILKGFNVLHPIGYDALGLPAENAAIKEKTSPGEYTKNSIKNFTKQFRTLGISYDWSRLIDTSDPSYYKWDQWIFLKMFERGLAYQKEAAVNWCPSCETVLANEQAQTGCCERCGTRVEIKHLKQWFLKITDYADELYEKINSLNWPDRTKAMQRNWIGKSHGTEIDFEINGEKWPIFTTRPDTIYGVTFMVVSAQHLRLNELVTKEQRKDVDKFLKKLKSVSQKDSADLEKEGVFTGSYATNPINGERVPIYAGNFVVADYGSGMVMAVPAHDQRDYEFAKKYGIRIKPVVLKKSNESYSFVMGIDEKEIKKIGGEIVEKTKKGFFKIKIPFNKLDDYKKFIRKNLKIGFWNEFSTEKGFYFVFKHKDGKIEEMELNEKTNNLIDKYGATFNDEKPGEIPENVYSWLAENDFYEGLLIHTEDGILINSDKFNGMSSSEAKKKITDEMIGKKVGRRVVNFRLRDWGIARQRYWGTPIPIISCEKCGAVPVPEKDLPVQLPREVKFGKGNPLETNEKWLNVKCPKCGGKGRREPNTMDTFVNSSWYFLRYCDPHNDKKIFDKKKADYWCPIDTYIGGAEHACMHLIYFRFYTKFLRDIGILNFDEPASRLFHQGTILAEDGEKMSKSRGNVVDPMKTVQKTGVDALRFFLVSVASPDKNFSWSEKGIIGSERILRRIFVYSQNFKSEKDSPGVLKKLNRTISNAEKYYENFQYRKATIEIRELFDLMEKSRVSKESFEKFLKILSPICPHITEEIWEGLGNKNFLSTSDWPKAERVKSENERRDINSNLVLDIKNILEKTGAKPKKVYLYVMPFEIDKVDKNKIAKESGFSVGIFAVNDSKRYDPQNKAKKAKPGKPSIFLE